MHLKNDTVIRSFFALLHTGLFGKPAESGLFLHFKEDDWETLFTLSVEQAVAGLIWEGILTLPESIQPPKPLWYKWLGLVLKAEKANEQLNRLIPEILDKLAGPNQLCFSEPITQTNYPKNCGTIPVALLKGQGTAAMYPTPHRRMPGDVDLFAGDYYAQLETIFKKEQNGFQRLTQSTKHTEYKYKDIVVENHRYVALFFCPWLAWRLKKLVKEWFPQELRVRKITLSPQQSVQVSVPPAWFEALFAVIHFRAHLHLEGIGWRQLCDWWLLRTQFHKTNDPISEQRFRYERGLRQLELIRMEQVMEEIFETLVLHKGHPADLSHYARLVYEEMADGGNMGHHTTNSRDHSFAWQKGFWRTLGNLCLFDLRRSVRYFRLFPGEAIFSPFFRAGGYIRRLGR